MQRSRRWRDFTCGLTLVGAVLLASPGARADAVLERSGPVCSTAQFRQRQDPSLEMFLAEVRQRAAAQRTSEGPGLDGWVVLNSRGYNYARTNVPPPQTPASPPASPPAAPLD